MTSFFSLLKFWCWQLIRKLDCHLCKQGKHFKSELLCSQFKTVRKNSVHKLLISDESLASLEFNQGDEILGLHLQLHKLVSKVFQLCLCLAEKYHRLSEVPDLHVRVDKQKLCCEFYLV